MSNAVLEVEIRENTGRGGARATRRAGLVPGVLYGGDEDAVAISMKENKVLQALNTGKLIASMVTISHKGETQSAITKDVQFHPVKTMPQHIDFYRVTATTIISLEVTVEAIGEEECPGVGQGGSVSMIRFAVEVNCPAGAIPDSLKIDVSKLEIGDTLHESDIIWPKDVKPAITDRDPSVVTIAAPLAEIVDEIDEDEVVEGVESEAVEGEEEGETETEAEGEG